MYVCEMCTVEILISGYINLYLPQYYVIHLEQRYLTVPISCTCPPALLAA